MIVQLRVIAGPDRGRTVPMKFYPIKIGRGRESDTGLTDPYVSRAHCRLEMRRTDLTLVDLGSSGGTFVNDERVSERVLRLGDVIRVGDTQLLLEEDIADQATLAPTDPAPGARTRRPAPAEPAPIAAPPPPADKPAAPAKGPPVLPVLPGNRLGELVGKVLAHYRIGPALAKGNSGVVFLADDLRDRRQVALKVLRPEFARDAAAVQRFVRSMKTALPLRHPNLVTLYGAGKKGPYCWVAMEYVEGESLTVILRRIGVAGMLDWRKAYWVAVHVGLALELAHRHHIVHRNLTPQNVIVQEKDKVARLGDLMLAKAFEGSSMEEDITRPGEILGDVRYMPPERTGGTADLDGRSDIYSLGALVYALLTGKPPFEGSSLVETLLLIREGKLVPPKQFQLSIPDAFQATVLRMLARRPEERMQTVTELLRELERVGKFQGLRG